MAPRPIFGGQERRSDIDAKELAGRDDNNGQAGPAPARIAVRAAQALSQRQLPASTTNPAHPNAAITRPSEDGIHTGARIGAAVGVVAAMVVLFGVVYFVWGRKRRSRRRVADEQVRTPSVFEPPVAKPDTSAAQTTLDDRTNSQILDELIATAYGDTKSNRSSAVADEKRRTDSFNSRSAPDDIDNGVTYPYHQAKMRPSVASWLRKVHPLQLNALSRWSFSTTKTRSSTATPSNRNTTTSAILSPRSLGPAMPVPPVPAIPAEARMRSDRFKSVWSETSAGTVETESDTRSRGMGRD